MSEPVRIIEQPGRYGLGILLLAIFYKLQEIADLLKRLLEAAT